MATLPLAPYTATRRSELQSLREKLTTQIAQLDAQVKQEAEQRPQTQLWLTHPGVGPVTALATAVFLGDAMRFADAQSTGQLRRDDSP